MPAIMRQSRKAQRIAEKIMGKPKNAPRKKFRKLKDNDISVRASIEAGAIV